MVRKGDDHVHKFIKLAEKKVPLSVGRKTGTDLIKLRVCECGKTQAYDLERIG